MKKFLAFSLAAVLSLTFLAGCGGGKGDNTPPVINGVKATAEAEVGKAWNALEGVTATDEEDGDLTSKIKVTCNSNKVKIENGMVTASEDRSATRPYTIVYSVTDKGGETVEKECALAVRKATAELEYVYEADFSDVKPKYDWAEGNEGEGNNHWWGLTKEDGSAATATLKEGILEVDVTNRNNVGDDKLMLTRGFEDLPIGRYKFAVWAKATPNVKINLNAILDEDSLNESITDNKWDTQNLGSGKYGEDVTAEYKVFYLDFEIKEAALKESAVTANKAKVLFRICLGGNENPNAFKFDVEKITIWKTTGSNTETDLFTLNPSSSTGGLVIDHTWEEAAATLGYDTTEQAVKLDVTKYNTKDGIWTIVLKAPLTGVTIEAGKKYGVEVEMKATTGFTPEFVIGSGEDKKDVDPRVIKNDTAIGNTAYTKITHEFETKDNLAEFVTETPYIFFQLGKNNETHTPNVDANAIYIKNIRFYEVEGSTKTDRFTLHAGAGETPEIQITNHGDGAEQVTASVANGGATITIGKYNTEPKGGIFSIVASLPFSGQTLVKDKTYGYEIVAKATTACKVEIACGASANKDSSDNDKLYSQDIGTTSTTIKHTFKAGTGISAPGIHFSLGKTDGVAESATSNTITIESFRFFEVEGNEETSKIQDKFVVFGDQPIAVFNQSDDVFDAAPMSTAYFENDKLVYIIHQGGTDGGHNKLQFGYWDHYIKDLPANAYYEVSFKIKASVELDFNLTLHDRNKSFEPADGGLLIRLMDFDEKEQHASTTELPITVTSDSPSLEAHAECELIFEFGKFLGNNKEVRIEISELKIGYRTVQA